MSFNKSATIGRKGYEHLPSWLARILRFADQNTYYCLAPVIVIVLFFALAESGHLNALENLTINLRFRMRAHFDKPANKKLILIGVDEYSLHEIGAWPWRRSVHGDLLQLLSAANSSTVLLDFLFTEPSMDPKEDDSFIKGMDAIDHQVVSGAASLDKASARNFNVIKQSLGLTKPLVNVVGDISKLNSSDRAMFPIPKLLDHSYFGFVDSDPSGGDGIRRVLPMVIRLDNQVWPSFVMEGLLLYWKIPPDQVVVKLGKYILFPTPDGPRRVPINARGEITINYRDKDIFTQCGYVDVIRQLGFTYIKGMPWPARYPDLKDSFVVVAQVASGLSDLGPNPLVDIGPLVLTHLNVINSILQEDYLTIVPNVYFLGIWLLLAYVTLISFRQINEYLAVLLPCLIVFGYIIVAFVLFWWRSLQIPIVWPGLSLLLVHAGAVILRWLEALRAKQHIKSVFASYISPGVMDNILKDPDSIKLGGERKPVTVFFSDIRGFTSFSEGANEVELVRQLNEYFEKMVDCVGVYEGTLHKYIGDAIMAVWGDVLKRGPTTDAKNAVRCALAMKKELVKLNHFWKEDGRMELKIGMGLNHGTVCVGNIGAPQRREFTVIGDAVNLASRLEGVTKVFHTDFCIGESVHNLLEGEFLTRTLSLLIVKGKTQPVRVYEVLDDLKGIEPMHFFSYDWVNRYENAFEYFLSREFEASAALFGQCLEEKPDDYMSLEYYRTSLECLEIPPGPEWDGVIKLEIK